MKGKTNNHESISPVKNYNIPITLHFLVYTSPSPSPSVVPPPQGKLFCCYFSCFQYNFTVYVSIPIQCFLFVPLPLNFKKNSIILYIFFCNMFSTLNIVFMRFIHINAYNSVSQP